MAASSPSPWGVAALLAGLAAVGPGSAHAEWDERFAPFFFDAAEPETLYLDGLITPRTALALSRALEAVGEPRTLVLSSPGGDVYAALLMAREVDRLGLHTEIPAGAICFSACAYLYFAGHNQRAEGELGVHQVSGDADLEAGQVALSDIVEILGDFEVPNDVLVLMLRTTAEDMYVFRPDELADLGLTGPRAAGGRPSVVARTEPPAGRVLSAEPLAAFPEEDALALVARFNEAWSEENDVALAEVRALYADRVEFYGTSVTREEVMADKVAFAERWVERDYVLDLSVTTATCASTTRCLVEGEVVWDARTADGARHSVGRAAVSIGIERIDGRLLIVREDGHVLERG